MKRAVVPVPIPVGGVLSSWGHPVVPAPSVAAGHAPLHPLEEVVGEPFTRSMVISYQAWLGVAHPAAGAACATQHLAGRVAAWLAGCWVLTGGLPPLQGCLAEVDEHGRTPRLVVPEVVTPLPATPLEVVDALQTCLEPMLATACAIGHITTRLAWGGVATGLAGALLRSVEHVDDATRSRVLSDATAMLAEQAWPVPRPLVTLDGPCQRRRTCCLIFLSTEHERCHTCPHHDRER